MIITVLPGVCGHGVQYRFATLSDERRVSPRSAQLKLSTSSWWHAQNWHKQLRRESCPNRSCPKEDMPELLTQDAFLHSSVQQRKDTPRICRTWYTTHEDWLLSSNSSSVFESPFNKWPKCSIGSFLLGPLNYGGKPVTAVADISLNLFPHLYKLPQRRKMQGLSEDIT